MVYLSEGGSANRAVALQETGDSHCNANKKNVSKLQQLFVTFPCLPNCLLYAVFFPTSPSCFSDEPLRIYDTLQLSQMQVQSKKQLPRHRTRKCSDFSFDSYYILTHVLQFQMHSIHSPTTTSMT